MGKIFCIGDIHGAYRALIQVLDRSGFDKKEDTLITLGDIADGWPYVDKCVEELLTINNRIDIIGNHDEWLHRYIQTGLHPDNWVQGGQGTFDSYDLGNGGFIPDHHISFFLRQSNYYVDDRKRLFVHGGFNPYIPIGQQSRIDLCWDRELWYDVQSGDVGEFAPTIPNYDGFDMIFIGHTALRNGIPLKSAGVWNLDTGAGWAGKLTIMNVENEEYWQSDNVQSLYPNEKGR